MLLNCGYLSQFASPTYREATPRLECWEEIKTPAVREDGVKAAEEFGK